MNRRTWTMRTGLTLAVAVAVLLLGIGSFARRVTTPQPEFGVQWIQSSRGPVAVSIGSGSAGEAAGVQVGDRLVRVGKLEVTSSLDAQQLSWLLRGSGGETLELDRSGDSIQVAVAPDWNQRNELYIYLCIVGIACWLSGSFIALRWPSIRGGDLYPLLATSMFVMLTFSHTGEGGWIDWAIYACDVIAAAFTPALLFHVAVVLARRGMGHPKFWLGFSYVASLSLVLGTIWLTPSGLEGAYRFSDPLFAVELWERLQLLLLAASVIGAFGVLLRAYYKSASTLHRGQMRWLLWGLGVGFGPVAVLYLIPWGLGAPDLPGWGLFVAVAPMLFVPAAFTAALARYRLHDLDVLLIRGLTEVSALIGTFAVYAAMVFLLREGINDLLPMSQRATRYVGFIVSGIAWFQLRVWVRAGVERAFYKKRYSYRATLLDWARELNAETDLASLLIRLRERVRATLGVPAAEVLLRRGSWRFEAVDSEVPVGTLELDEASMERLESESFIAMDTGSLAPIPWARYLFALKVKGSLRAILAIAERHAPEEPLSSEDRALLGTLSAHAASAIETARLVREVRQRADEVELLHAREAKILESSAVGLLLLDEDGQILAWNRALEAIYGCTREEVIGRKLREVFPLHAVQRIEREAAPNGEARIFRLGLVNRKGRRVVVNLAITATQAEEGAGSRVVTVDDVTEQVKLEEQLLQQERLASLGLLAAGVAHEINTPLTGISSYTQLLLESDRTPEAQKGMLEKIESQTTRATEITRSLLNLARPEGTTLERVDLNASIHEIYQLFEPQIRGRQIELKLELDDSLPALRGSKGKLQQVLLNLLINARDALRDGGQITIRSSRDHDKVRFEVIDNGPGISEEDLPRIFDPFFTTKVRGKGTGLGLSICYGIVQQHGGDMTVESTIDNGARFTIVLPADHAALASGS